MLKFQWFQSVFVGGVDVGLNGGYYDEFYNVLPLIDVNDD